MKPSSKCLKLVCQFEGFRAKPYLCPAGKWTIGYGSTFYEDGRPVTKNDGPITEARALAMMEHTLIGFAEKVEQMLRVPVKQHEFDALVDFAYNAGPEALRNSTLLRKLNMCDRAGAAKEFDRWVYAGGVRLEGLTRRRAAECALFLGQA